MRPPRPQLGPSADGWIPEKRLALVIGNSSYGHQGSSSQLAWADLQGGPIKDAEAMAARLRQLHFEVMLVTDADLDQLNMSLVQFDERIRAAPGSLALFYFAGHGAQAPLGIGKDGEDNYLIPVRTNLTRETDAHFKALPLSDVRDVLRHSRAGIVILDACRNNALQRAGTRAMSVRGLLAAESISGMLVAYAAPPGQVTENRPGQTSRYTQSLVEQLGKPGQSVTSMFRSVRKQAQDSGLDSNHLPEFTDKLNEDIVLEAQ